jgi:hypothetical protein
MNPLNLKKINNSGTNIMLLLAVVQSRDYTLPTMRHIRRPAHSILAILLAFGLASFSIVPARAELASAPSLTISQLKITSGNGQFVTLYNPTELPLDMSRYQLEYFNSYDASKATSSRLIPLSGTLQPHSYYMVNDSAQLLCFKMTVDSVSLGFSSTAGLIEVLGFNQSSPGGPVTPTLQDYSSWSKTAALGAQTLPSNTNAFLQRIAPNGAAGITTPGSGSWQPVQPDPANPCSLVTANTPGLPAPVDQGSLQLLPGMEPPAIFESATDSGAGQAVADWVSDNGLKTPLITEILPNPNGTGNDGADEFIELFNPNQTQFVLTGFTLQTGTTSLHSYTFSVGAAIPPNGYAVLYSLTTGLSLSNTNGQVRLLSPSGTQIATTEAYGTAKEGQSWALAVGRWQWTTRPTPGSTNIISTPASTKKSTKTGGGTAAKKSSGSVKGASTKAKSKKPKTSTGTLVAADIPAESKTPLHTWVLVSVGSLAVLYGAYEYRADLANRIYELRRYASARRKNRQ